MIGSLVCSSSIKYGLERPNLFCSDPLKYVHKKDLNKEYDFETKFVSTVRSLLEGGHLPKRNQGLLANGYQTAGNLFDLEAKLQKKFRKFSVMKSIITTYALKIVMRG